MEDLTILAAGDADYLAMVLNAIAMFGGTDNHRYLLLGLIGAMIGLIMVGAKAISSGGKEFEVQWLFLGALIYGVLFGQTTSVWVESVNDQPPPGAEVSFDNPRKIDNVPLGVAFLGAMISRMGYAITSQMEIAFGDTSGYRVTQGGFGRTIELMQLPMALADPRIEHEELAHYITNVSNYISDCYSDAVSRGRLNVDALTTQGDLMEVLGNAASSWSTTEVIKLRNGEVLAVTCREAFTSYVNLSDDDLEALIDVELGKVGTAQGFSLELSSLDGLREAMASVGVMENTEGSKARGLALAALMTAAIDRSNATALMTDTRGAMQVMVQQATRQRSTQWMAEATLFGKVVRPMIGFFEGLVIAVAPFMAFMAGMGRFGWTKILTYLTLSIWVHLWLPVLAITNLYMSVQARHFFNSQDLGADGGVAIPQAAALFTQSMEWFSSAATIAAATPAITLMLIFGGAMTATHLAGRLQGGDFVNEKIAAPDAVSPGAVVQQSAQMGWEPGKGLRGVGAEGRQITYNSGEEIGQTVSSRSTESAESAQALASRVSTMLKDVGGLSQGSQSALDSSIRSSVASSNSQVSQWLERQGFGEDFRRAHNLSSDEVLSRLQQATAGGRAGLGGGLDAGYTKGEEVASGARQENYTGGSDSQADGTAAQSNDLRKAGGGKGGAGDGKGHQSSNGTYSRDDRRTESGHREGNHNSTGSRRGSALSVRGNAALGFDGGVSVAANATESQAQGFQRLDAFAQTLSKDQSLASSLQVAYSRDVVAGTRDAYDESASFRQEAQKVSGFDHSYTDAVRDQESFERANSLMQKVGSNMSVGEIDGSRLMVQKLGGDTVEGKAAMSALVSQVKDAYGADAFRAARQEAAEHTMLHDDRGAGGMQLDAAAMMRVVSGNVAGYASQPGASERQDDLHERVMSTVFGGGAKDIDRRGAYDNSEVGQTLGGASAGTAAQHGEEIEGQAAGRFGAAQERIAEQRAAAEAGGGASAVVGGKLTDSRLNADSDETAAEQLVGSGLLNQSIDGALGQRKIESEFNGSDQEHARNFDGHAQGSTWAGNFWKGSNMSSDAVSYGSYFGGPTASEAVASVQGHASSALPNNPEAQLAYAGLHVQKADSERWGLGAPDSLWDDMDPALRGRMESAIEKLSPQERAGIDQHLSRNGGDSAALQALDRKGSL